MQIKRLTAKNFQSYVDIEFDYSNLGLTLISGQTKSGKSTLMDAACWVLYGTTSKDSAADDVRAWFADGEPTWGLLEVETSKGGIQVYRQRGKPSQNDLYWIEDNGADPIRGKDIKDTQRLLEERLGVSAELYLNGSYIHQFSRADAIFTANAKERRESFERIADLSLAVKIADRASERRKAIKKELEICERNKLQTEGSLSQIVKDVVSLKSSYENWGVLQEEKIAALAVSSNTFEEEKNEKVMAIVSKLEELDKILKPVEFFEKRYAQLKDQEEKLHGQLAVLQTLNKQILEINAELRNTQKQLVKFKEQPDICPHCLGNTNNGNREKHLSELQAKEHELLKQLKKLEPQQQELDKLHDLHPKLIAAMQKVDREVNENERVVNKFEQLQNEAKVLKDQKNYYLVQIEQAKAATNPYEKQYVDKIKAQRATERGLVDYTEQHEALTEELSCLTWLYDKSFELRGALLNQTIQQINLTTNEYLEKFFDAPIRVKFALKDADKLDILITNEGYDCPYKQLSGGERCMLKLAFALSYVKLTEYNAGIKFETLMLDESFAGLDAGLKVKAFHLLESVSNFYGTVLVIDHSEELKLLFPKEFHVSKDGISSSITEIERD